MNINLPKYNQTVYAELLQAMAIEESVANNTEKLKNIRENESASISGGMYELIHTENIYYYKKYGFLIIRNAQRKK